jgi:hypothetical protein
MGVSKTVTVVCDYSKCLGNKTGPAVVQWNETDVSSGKAELPEEAKYLVLITHNNVQKAFCCQLHAAEYFLPPGYEAKQKQVIELPTPKEEPDPWALLPKEASWMDEPPRSEESPSNGQGGPVC